MSTTFREWLEKQRRRDDPVGDLARDVSQDTRFTGDSADDLRENLVGRGLIDLVEPALSRAVREFDAAAEDPT